MTGRLPASPELSAPDAAARLTSADRTDMATEGTSVGLPEYARAARRRWHWILVPALLAVALTGVLTAAGSPEHRSSMVLFVITAGPDDADARTSRLNSYVALLTGPRVAGAVAAELRLPLSTRAMQEKIAAEVQPGTDLLVVTATDASARQSQAIVTTATRTLIGLARQLEPPRTGASGPAVTVAVAQEAVTVREPRGLPRSLALAGLSGLLIGAVAVAVRELRHRTVTHEPDLRRLGLDTVGVISIGGPPGRAGGVAHPDEALAEAFRRLRTVLPDDGFAPSGGIGGRTLLITGSVPDEGTTAIACGLAIATAEAGHSVVLVDANLRTPGVGRYLSLDTTRGLADVLAGSAVLRDVLQDSPGGRLTVLPAGFRPADPGALLATPMLGETIERLTNRFDTVLIDAPPLESVADAAVLGKMADAVLLVVRAGATRAADVERSVDLLRRVGAHLIGAVLNALPNRLPDAESWRLGEMMSPAPPPVSTAVPALDGWYVPPIMKIAHRRSGTGQIGSDDTRPVPVRGQARVGPQPAATGRARVVDLSVHARGQATVVKITDAGQPAADGGGPDARTVPTQRGPDEGRQPGT
jgi:capsular exopolysaccharide synthesis family protein